MKNRVTEEFTSRFGTAPTAVYTAPGRINLIGEHTDYNLGFVLPGAIDKAIYLAIKPNGSESARVYSIDFDTHISISLKDDAPDPQWAKYIFGVVKEMEKRGASPRGFDCVFGGNIPLGAGLSSSAALENVFSYALNDLFGCGFDRRELAVIGQMTEHNHVGVRCGIMDQFASLFGRTAEVIKLDCRSLEYELIPFSPAGYRVVLIDSMVKHSLASSQYNIRREQCEEGVAIVARREKGIASLRDVTFDMLDRYGTEMSPVVFRRCRYILEENCRLLEGCEELKAGDYAAFGHKMFGSHDGLSKDYEVSCAELDFIVDMARDADGILGARMMGGGFGGCVIHIMDERIHDSYTAEVQERFNVKFGIVPRIIDVVIGDGARRLE